MLERQTSRSILNPESKIISSGEAGELSRSLKKEGNKIVFTNGCFDLIHAGHATYLLAARKLGDSLFVGMNSDSSVKRIKGERRPIVPEKERAIVLASFGFVDHVVLFNEDTPFELIKIIEPDILVKGEDWSVEDIVGRDLVIRLGGEVKAVPLVKGLSSSRMIERIIESYSSLDGPPDEG